MSKERENINSYHGGFLPLKEFGKRNLLNEIFGEYASEIHDKIWKNGKEEELHDEYAYRASIDLGLGKEVYISTKEEQKNLEREDKVVSIEPGEFALLQSYEKIYIPKELLGFISIRYTYKKKGLVNVSGFHVDPGYEGHITFSVYNAGPNPVVLRYKDKVFTIFFSTLTQTVDKARREILGVTPGYGDIIPAKDIEEIKGPPISLPLLQKRLEKAETNIKTLIALLITFVGASIMALVTTIFT